MEFGWCTGELFCLKWENMMISGTVTQIKNETVCILQNPINKFDQLAVKSDKFSLMASGTSQLKVPDVHFMIKTLNQGILLLLQIRIGMYALI